MHFGQRFKRQIGVDGLGAVPGQGGKMVDFPWLCGFNHKPNRRAQTLADQVVVHRSRRQQGRDRYAGGAELAVRQDDDVIAAFAPLFRRARTAVRGSLSSLPGRDRHYR